MLQLQFRTSVSVLELAKIIFNFCIIMQNYSYLKPPSKFIKNYSASPRKIDSGERVVFGGTDNKLTSQQSQALLRLKEYLKNKNPSKDFDDQLLLRYCNLGQFRTNQSVEKFRYYQEWHAMQPISRQKQRGILYSGVFYCYGKDDSYSPNIYFHPSRINLADFTIQDYLVSLRTLLTPIEQNMLIPGKIQTWNIIVDVRSFNDSKFKNNYSIIVNNLIKICNAYPYRAKKIFLVVPGQYGGLWSKVGFSSNSYTLVQQAIDQLNLSSIRTHISNLRQFDKYIPAEEREKQYGGYLQNLSQFWPITSTNKLMEVNSRFIDASYDSGQQYESIANDVNASFFGEKQEKRARCNFKQFCSIQ